MKIESIEYFDGTQKLVGKLVYDEINTGKRPAVILFHAFEGLGSFTVDYAKKIAEKGYVIFAADMYGNGEVSKTIEGCFKLITPFLQDRELVRRRALLAYKILSKRSEIDTKKIGAMGFCFGGMCVLELARSGENLRAAVTAHGVLAKSNLPTHSIKANLLVLHGYKDPQVPPTQLQLFAQEMETANVSDWTYVFFSHAKHSFTDPATGTFDPAKEHEMGREYNEIAAKRTFEYAIDFFSEKLT